MADSDIRLRQKDDIGHVFSASLVRLLVLTEACRLRQDGPVQMQRSIGPSEAALNNKKKCQRESFSNIKENDTNEHASIGLGSSVTFSLELGER
jgi:hypothetical protein